jgi:hypothetical protein
VEIDIPTAITVLLSAIIGALVGGYLSYVADKRADIRQQRVGLLSKDVPRLLSEAESWNHDSNGYEFCEQARSVGYGALAIRKDAQHGYAILKAVDDYWEGLRQLEANALHPDHLDAILATVKNQVLALRNHLGSKISNMDLSSFGEAPKRQAELN